MTFIATISGNSRPDNYTSRALSVVNDELRLAGVTPQMIDARYLDLPFPGQPPTADARALCETVGRASGIVLATPEYQGTFSAMMKLIIENLGFPSQLAGKPVALVGVASGRLGAIKTLEQLRSVCAHNGAIALPGAVSIADVRAAFDSEGRCIEAKTEARLRGLARELVGFVAGYRRSGDGDDLAGEATRAS